MKTYLLIALFHGISIFAGPISVFRGTPSIKITEAGLTRVPEKMSSKDAANMRCVVSEIEEKYYWATRENKEVARIQAGAYITYIALDGSGYIRTVNPDFKNAVSILGGTEAKFDYVEHLLIGLRSVTYYGTISE